MTTILRFFLSALAGAVPLTGSQAEPLWTVYGFTDDFGEWRYDQHSIVRNGDLVSVWVKHPDIRLRYDGSYTKIQEQIDCPQRQWKPLWIAKYDELGELTASSRRTDDYVPVVPDSVGEELYDVVCRYPIERK